MILLCIIGLCLIFISIKRHKNQWFKKETLSQTQAITLRILGYLALIIALVIGSNSYGFGLSSTLFFGLLSPLILAITIINPRREN